MVSKNDFKVLQKTILEKKKKIITDELDGWSSTYLKLQRFLELYEVIIQYQVIYIF